MSAEFFAVQEQDRSRLDRATKTTYVNLDAILYVDDYGVRGEPMRVSCVGKETYWLVNDDAERLVAKLKERCKP